jgi:hypothetical protein
VIRFRLALIIIWIVVAGVMLIVLRRHVQRRNLAILTQQATPTPTVWRVFDGGVFFPRNGEVPFVRELPLTCQPCDYVHLEAATPSLYECATTVSLADCREATKKRIATKRAATSKAKKKATAKSLKKARAARWPARKRS